MPTIGARVRSIQLTAAYGNKVSLVVPWDRGDLLQVMILGPRDGLRGMATIEASELVKALAKLGFQISGTEDKPNLSVTS